MLPNVMNSKVLPSAGVDLKLAKTPPDFEAWGFIAVTAMAAIYAINRFIGRWDVYEIAIFIGILPPLAWSGFYWKGWRRVMLGAGLALLVAANLYQGDLAQAQGRFILKYFLASQSAIMWMCTLVVLSTLTYWLGFFMNRQQNRADSGFVLSTASALTWGSVFFGISGLLVRWHESYLLGADIGHIPVSNLYEVSVLFCLVTMIILLYNESKTGLKTLSAFVMLVVLADTIFTLWYALSRQAFMIQPLIPALQSWWMKIHVPANFVGYGAFSAAAMLGVPHLIAQSSSRWAAVLPSSEKIEEVMYRLIGLGFVAFTIATILGALWAAEAWGAYWQWDPKETWALIVWLNYAAWLHIRHLRKISAKVLSWWAILGLVITAFAFYGVNMFLSGLHSYGNL